MMFFITWSLIFSFIGLVVCETARVRDLFINYALVSYICALASPQFTKTFVILLSIAAFSFVTYVFYKDGKKWLFQFIKLCWFIYSALFRATTRKRRKWVLPCSWQFQGFISLVLLFCIIMLILAMTKRLRWRISCCCLWVFLGCWMLRARRL